jgi:hypothetical protein
MRAMPRWFLVALAVCLSTSCGSRPPPPPRGVVEGDLGGWKFRRFQPVLDVEVWVPDNRAEAFTATYVKEEAEKRGRLDDADLVSVFVTRYERDDGVLRETVKFVRRLAQEAGYQVDEATVGGVRAVTIAGHGESWVLWAAPRHVVKVGGRGRDDVPSAVVERYADRYPSVLVSGVLEGPLPPGPSEPAPAADAPYDPDSPSPDWDGYDPKKAKPKKK